MIKLLHFLNEKKTDFDENFRAMQNDIELRGTCSLARSDWFAGNRA